MNRRVLLGIAGWLTVAVAATAAGIAAIDVLEDGITGQSVRPLDDEAVHRALSRSGTSPTMSPTMSPTTSPTMSPGATPRPSPAASSTGSSAASPDGVVTRNLATGGGTVTARCEGGRVTVVAAIPAQGFRTDDIQRGPAPSAALTFESAEEEFAVTVTCEGGAPVAHSVKDDGHHGRHRGRG
jgi:hypothetical protein